MRQRSLGIFGVAMLVGGVALGIATGVAAANSPGSRMEATGPGVHRPGFGFPRHAGPEQHGPFIGFPGRREFPGQGQGGPASLPAAPRPSPTG
jgi:hypothetical protein